MENNQEKTLQATEETSKQRVIRTSIYIAVFLACVVGLTFCFKLSGLIDSFLLKVVLLYSIYIAMIALVFLVCFIEKRKVRDLGFTKENLLIQIVLGGGIAIVLSFLIGALPILISGGKLSLIGSKPESTLGAVYSIVTDLIFIGTFEELIFRGYIQTRINELTKHKFIGVLIAAALFGIWHIINGNFIQVAFTFVIGAVFGFSRAYIKNCSLLSVIVAHGLYDALLVVITIILL